MTPRSRLSLVAPVAMLAFVLATSPARASAPDTPPPATAEQLAEQAYQEHVSGKDADAIATYLRAYGLSQAGALLFNVATIYDRKLGERGLAEDYYRRYLVAPDAEPDLVKKATERLTALKKEDEDEAAAKHASIVVAPVPTTSPPATPPPPPPAAPPVAGVPAADASIPTASSGRTLRTAGIVVGAFGVAGLGASVVLGVLAKEKNDDANAVCNGAACSNEGGVTLANQAGSLANGSTVAFVSGLALIGGGITMYLLAPKDASAGRTAISLSPQIGQSRAGLSVGGTF